MGNNSLEGFLKPRKLCGRLRLHPQVGCSRPGLAAGWRWRGAFSRRGVQLAPADH